MAEFVEMDDVGMRNAVERAKFGADSRQVFARGVEDLECDALVAVGLDRLVYLSLAAATEEPDESEWAESIAGTEFRSE